MRLTLITHLSVPKYLPCSLSLSLSLYWNLLVNSPPANYNELIAIINGLITNNNCYYLLDCRHKNVFQISSDTALVHLLPSYSGMGMRISGMGIGISVMGMRLVEWELVVWEWGLVVWDSDLVIGPLIYSG